MHYIHHPYPHYPQPQPVEVLVLPTLLLFFSVILLVVFPVSDYTPGAPSVISDGSPVVKNYTVGNSSVIRVVRKHGFDYTKIKTE